MYKMIPIIPNCANEGTTDSTFTTHRGIYMLMTLGLVLAEMKIINQHNILTNHEDTANQ